MPPAWPIRESAFATDRRSAPAPGWMVPSMASGFASSAPTPPEGGRGHARACEGPDASAELVRRLLEPYEVDRQEGVGVLDDVDEAQPVPAGCVRRLHGEIDVGPRLCIATRPRTEENHAPHRGLGAQTPHEPAHRVRHHCHRRYRRRSRHSRSPGFYTGSRSAQRAPPRARICFSSSVQLRTMRKWPPCASRRSSRKRPSGVTS